MAYPSALVDGLQIQAVSWWQRKHHTDLEQTKLAITDKDIANYYFGGKRLYITLHSMQSSIFHNGRITAWLVGEVTGYLLIQSFLLNKAPQYTRAHIYCISIRISPHSSAEKQKDEAQLSGIAMLLYVLTSSFFNNGSDGICPVTSQLQHNNNKLTKNHRGKL